MFAHAISSTMPTTVIRITEMLDDRRAPLTAGIQPRVEQRHRTGAASLVVDRKCLRQLREDRFAVGRGLLQRHARLQPSEGEEEQARAACSYQSKFGCTTACIDIGTQTDGPPPSRVPVNPFGATPMTVNGVRLKVSVLPTMRGIAAEAALPEPVADDGDWRRLLVFLRHGTRGRAPAARRAARSNWP